MIYEGGKIFPINWQKHYRTIFLSSSTNPCRENVNTKFPLKIKGSQHSDQLQGCAEEQGWKWQSKDISYHFNEARLL